MNQVVAFQESGSPLGVPVSADNPLPIVFVDAPVGGPNPAGLRPQVIAFQGAAGEPLGVPVSEQNPLPVSLV